MKSKVKVIVLRTAGTNCDEETAYVFKHCGASVDLVHINKLFKKEVFLKDYHILAIPGGFTYGDNIESGRILANELIAHLGDDICEFLNAKKLVIGICNGFQVLVKAGILPGPLDQKDMEKHDSSQKSTLINNDSNKFESRWSYLKTNKKSIWTKDLEEIVYFPVAHAEGKFVAKKSVLKKLNDNGQIAFQYCSKEGKKPNYPENPNGADDNIAGITDRTGRILGLMPHPERHFFTTQHPFWTRLDKKCEYGQGARIFQNGVNYVKEKLLK